MANEERASVTCSQKFIKREINNNKKDNKIDYSDVIVFLIFVRFLWIPIALIFAIFFLIFKYFFSFFLLAGHNYRFSVVPQIFFSVVHVYFPII